MERLIAGLLRRVPSLAVDPATLAILVADLTGETYEVVQATVIAYLAEKYLPAAPMFADAVGRQRVRHKAAELAPKPEKKH